MTGVRWAGTVVLAVVVVAAASAIWLRTSVAPPPAAMPSAPIGELADTGTIVSDSKLPDSKLPDSEPSDSEPPLAGLPGTELPETGLAEPAVPERTTAAPPSTDSTPGPTRGPTIARTPPASPRSNRLIIPVQGIRPADLVDTYTAARGAGRAHDAIDIIAPRGTPVLAAADGTVMKLFDSDQGGTTLYQLGTDGRTVYYYAHLDRYAPGIAEDQFLVQGTVLGYVGDTGNALPGNYHLHFEVGTTDDPDTYWGTEPINPYPLLTDTLATEPR